MLNEELQATVEELNTANEELAARSNEHEQLAEALPGVGKTWSDRPKSLEIADEDGSRAAYGITPIAVRPAGNGTLLILEPKGVEA